MAANMGSTTMRNLPDVAMVAQNVWVIYNNGNSGNFYGTSCASPLWAGFMALVNQQAMANGYPPVGFLNPAIYAIGKGANYAATFHDITAGNNTSSSSPTEFYAVAGYDLCTGWGTPNGFNLINALAIPDPLGVAPGNGFMSTEQVGGPFSQTNLNFTLTNAGADSLNWSLANTSVWLSVSASGGSLPAGTATTISASVNASSTNLVPGYYPATIIFSNLSSGIFQTRQFNLVVGVGLVWNGGAGTRQPQDGSGTWINQSAANTNWWNGSGNVPWNNASPDIATFGSGSGAAGTVTVSGAVTTGGINFNAPGSGNYTISGSGPLTLNGNINAGVSATINAPLTLGLPATFTAANSRTLTISSLLAGSSANDLTIVGPGTVSLTAQNNTAPSLGMGGSVYVNSGTLSVGSGNSEYGALGNVAGISIAAGATLSLQSYNALSGYEAAARNVTLNGGTLTAVNGYHQVNLLTFNGGTISSSGSVTFGSIMLDNNCYVTANSTISAQNFMLDSPNGAFYISTNATLTFPGTIADNTPGGFTSSLTLNGGGIMLLTATNAFSGTVTINYGDLQLNPGGNGGNSIAGLLGSVSSITINAGGTLNTLGNNAISGSGGSARNIILNGGTLIDGAGNHAIASLMLNRGTVSGDGNTTAGSYNLKGNCIVTDNSTICAQNLTTAAGSIFNVSSNVTLTISGTIIGSGGCNLTGGGAMVMSGTNTYTGNTTVSNGTLEVDGALGNTPVVIVGGKLTGMGEIAGTVTVEANAIFSPGQSDTIGTLAVDNQLTLAGASLMQLNRTNTQNCARVTGITTLTNGGVLTLSNSGPALQNGDNFQLFSARTYRGTFTTVNLPALGSGLVWDTTQLAQSGIVAVTNLPLPLTGGIAPGGGFQLSFGGPAGSGYRVLTSSSLLLPLTNWTAISTGIFNASPASFTDFGTTNTPLQFYRIVSP